MIEYREVCLADYTTTRIGGTADNLVIVDTITELTELLASLKEQGTNKIILGGGSNLLAKDSGFAGTAIKLGFTEKKLKQVENKHFLVSVQAGEDWDNFVQYTLKNQLAGLEVLSGIPGTVGGAIVQNIGAYGREIQEFVQQVQVLELTSGKISTWPVAQLKYNYRDSILKHNNNFVVLSADLILEKNEFTTDIKYAELAKQVNSDNNSAGIATTLVREKVLKLRKSKGMVLDNTDPDTNSTGSFFTNPLVDKVKVDELQQIYPQLPVYDFHTKYKLSAAWLIEKAGFHKGFKLKADSPIQLSTKHTLAICNYGGGTFQQIMELSTAIIAGVQEKFGVKLELEPVILG